MEFLYGSIIVLVLLATVLFLIQKGIERYSAKSALPPTYVGVRSASANKTSVDSAALLDRAVHLLELGLSDPTYFRSSDWIQAAEKILSAYNGDNT